MTTRLLPTRGLVAALLFSLLAYTTTAAEAPAAPTHYKASDIIVILGAVPQEITVFTAAMGNPPQETLWGIPYYRGKLAGKSVVVAITGIGSSLDWC